MSYHVLSLEAENFKRLRAVHINPTGALVEISGDNGEGKSSTLDAIWAALGGKDACPDKPIHSGSEAAIMAKEAKSEVRLILGQGGEPKLKVTRRFKPREGGDWTTDLIVETPEGARYDKAQGILDTLVGALCFDPLAFTRLPDKDQISALRRFVPEVDFATVEGLNKRDFENRADINRDIKSLKGQLDALPQSAGDIPERVDTEALEKQLAEAADFNIQVERRKTQREQFRDTIEEKCRQRDARRARAEQLRNEAAEMDQSANDLNAEIAEDERKLAGAEELPTPTDVADIRAKLDEGRQINALVDRAARRQQLEQQIAEKDEAAARLTQAMVTRKENAAKAVQAAKMPVPGLGFGENADGSPFVTLNGQPFSQASQAQQIRASVAIAGAMNPELRVAMIKDGSLLDKKSWAALTEFATANDLQLWVETVDQKTTGAVIIEDGGNRFQPKPPADDVGDVL